MATSRKAGTTAKKPSTAKTAATESAPKVESAPEPEVVEEAPEAPVVSEAPEEPAVEEADSPEPALEADTDDDIDEDDAEELLDALESNPTLLARFKKLVGLGNQSDQDQYVEEAPLSDAASGLPVNTLVAVEWSKERAAKAFGFTPKSVMAYAIRGGAPDPNGNVSEEIYLVVVTQDAKKHAKLIS